MVVCFMGGKVDMRRRLGEVRTCGRADVPIADVTAVRCGTADRDPVTHDPTESDFLAAKMKV